MKVSRNYFFLILICSLTPLMATAQPINDFPCSAILLTVGDECNFQRFTNLNSTASGITLTECNAYEGGDVWFKVVVPYTGSLTATIHSDALQQSPNNDGWIYRPGLAIYRGTCSVPIYDTCWIDVIHESPPRKPEIQLNGFTYGDTLFLRVWEYANNDNGMFDICIFDHSNGIPSDITIPQGFSPNGDGINEAFEIVGVHLYPDNELSVYNIWGNEVFIMKQYNNLWKGKSSNNIALGNDLPTGTYYYILKLEKTLIIKGHIYLKRE